MRAERAAELHSCLYQGTVTHRRLRPFEHAFSYRLFCVYLDLAELDRIFRGRWCWSTSRPAPAWFRRSDHFGDPAAPLDECVRELVQQQTGRRPTGSIRLLTHLRYFGYVINPISLYYCYDETGTTIEACVAEVTNTPWGERHCYVLPDPIRKESVAELVRVQPAREEAEVSRLQLPGDANTPDLWSPKELHVSPFLPMEMRYRWQLTAPAEHLTVGIENFDADGRAFSAGLRLQRRPLTTWQLSRALLRFPCITAQIAAGIYWQAAKLWWKGARFHPHPRHRAAPPRRRFITSSLRRICESHVGIHGVQPAVPVHSR